MITADELPNRRLWTDHSLWAVVICTILLALPAILNRAPFVYFDSGSYLETAGKAVQLLQDRLGLLTALDADAALSGAAPLTTFVPDDTILAGRSIYYGLFAWTGAESLGLGTVVVLQALTLAGLIVLALHTAWPGAPQARRTAAAVMIAGGLALFTSAGLFVSLVMPDIWAGLMILAFALLVASGPGLSRRGLIGLGAIMALAVLFHNSHLLLMAVLTGLLSLAMLRPRWRRSIPPWRLTVAVAALACGLAGQVVFSQAVIRVTGQPPLSMPFVTAHLVDMGPGARLARNSCPESGFAICPYADRLPTGWIDFLFSRDDRVGVFKTVTPAVQRALSQEQARFVLATLAAEPLATVGGLLRDGIAQLWHLSVDDVPLTAANETSLAINFPEQAAQTVRASAIWSRPWVAPAMTRLIEAGTAVAAVGLAVLALSGRFSDGGPLATLVVVCVAGVVLNALICGALASPYGRFQARIAWILPFLFALTVLMPRYRASAALN